MFRLGKSRNGQLLNDRCGWKTEIGDDTFQAMKAALTKFACLDCRKVFKRPSNAARRMCPHFGLEARRVGSDFKAPTKDDAKAWKVASFLLARGFPYYRLGFAYLTSIADAEAFGVTHASEAVSEQADGRNGWKADIRDVARQ